MSLLPSALGIRCHALSSDHARSPPKNQQQMRVEGTCVAAGVMPASETLQFSSLLCQEGSKTLMM